MAKLTLLNIPSGYLATTAINTNFSDLISELQNKVLYRDNPDGEPNAMQNNLDMNGYNILNLGSATVIESASASVTKAITWGTQLDGTGTHSLSSGYAFRTTEVSASSSVTACLVLMPESTGGWSSNQWAKFVQKGSGPIKFVAGSGVTVRAKGTVRTNIQYGQAIAEYRGSDVWYLSGDLSAS